MTADRLQRIDEQRLTPGVHFGKVIPDRSTTTFERREVRGAHARLNIDGFLRKFPFGNLVFDDEYREIHKDGLRGFYDPFDRSINLLTKWPQGSFSKEYDDKDTWLIAELGATQLDVVKRGFIHELGHHLHSMLGPEVDTDIQDVFTEVAGGAITKRARYSHREYFSENLTAYVFEQELLHTADPRGYKLIERVLRIARERGSAL